MTPRRELVEAGAGSGKTYSLVSRFVEGLGYDPESGAALPKGALRAQPDELISLTFTEEAALQMQERILERLRTLGLAHLCAQVSLQSQISTFHGLCYSLLKPLLPSRGYAADATLYPSPLAYELRRRHLNTELARIPGVEKLFRSLSLSSLSSLGAMLWFSLLSDAPESNPDKVKGWLHDYFDQFQKFLKDSRTLCQQAFAAFPEYSKSSEKAWLRPFFEILESCDSSRTKELNFRTEKKVKEAFPELYERAVAFRDFLESPLKACFTREAIAEEAEALADLLKFLAAAAQSGPKILDFSALEYELAQVLSQSTSRVIAAPKLLLVDEFQDTNRVQYSILQKISDDRTEWFFVGDPKQSIYAFRGGDISLFMEMGDRLTLKRLGSNFRTEAPLLKSLNLFGDLLFQSATNEYDPPSQPLEARILAASSPSPLVFNVAPKGLDFTTAVFSDIQKNRTELGANSRHAVLFNSWRRLYGFAENCEERRIPVAIAGSENFLDHPLTELFCLFLEWLHDPTKIEKLAPLLRWRSPLNWKPGLPDPDFVQLFSQRMGLDQILSTSFSMILYRFCLFLQIERWPRGPAWASAMERQLQDLGHSQLRDLFDLASLAKFFRDHHAQLDSSVPDPNADSNNAGLFLMTIHGSKGLEFDAVYLPDLYERTPANFNDSIEDSEGGPRAIKMSLADSLTGRSRPSLYYTLQNRNQRRLLEAEKRRLLYVAFTRAKKALHVYLHKPGEAKANTDFLTLLGSQKAQPTYWNEFFSRPPFQTLGSWSQSVEAQQEEAPEDSVTNAAELWSIPAPLSQPLQLKEFSRGGVSSYVEQVFGKMKREDVRPTFGESAAQGIERGLELHRLLELWNGKAESLQSLSENSPNAEVLRAAALKIRELPELAFYWQTLRESPSHVLREQPLSIRGPDYSLFGIADAVCLNPKASEATLIDWKTSSSLTSLTKTERLDRIKEQLRLYAQAFSSKHKIEGLAVGIELGDGLNAKVEVLWRGALT